MPLSDEQKHILDTANALEAMMKTQGWKYLHQYMLIRVKGNRSKLSMLDLVTKLSEASRLQGEIQGFNRIIGKINDVLKKAKKVQEVRAIERAKENGKRK